MSRTTATASQINSATQIIRNVLGGLPALSFLDNAGSVVVLETESLKNASATNSIELIEFVADGLSGNMLDAAAKLLLALEPFSANEIKIPTSNVKRSKSGQRGRSVPSEAEAALAWEFISQAKGIADVRVEYEEEDGRLYFSADRKLPYALRRKGVSANTLVDTALLLGRLLPYVPRKEEPQAE